MGKTTLAISLLALLSVVIFAQSATAAAHKVVIAVDASGTPTVDSDRATLSVSSGDTVVWVPSQGISGFSVVFDSGSPFSRSSFNFVWPNYQYQFSHLQILGLGQRQMA